MYMSIFLSQHCGYFVALMRPVVTSENRTCLFGKMATEPNKTEILTIFKRLRSIPTNKVKQIYSTCYSCIRMFRCLLTLVVIVLTGH